MKSFWVSTAFGLGVSLAVMFASLQALMSGSASEPVNLTGTWDMTVTGDYNASDCEAEFEHSGDSFSGTFDCPSESGSFSGTVTTDEGEATVMADMTLTPDGGPAIIGDSEGIVNSSGDFISGTWQSTNFPISGEYTALRLTGPPTPSPTTSSSPSLSASPSPTPTPASLNSVEFTQAIQEWQTLQELKDDLDVDQSPPVPMVAGKPGTLRVYFDEVDEETTVKVDVSGDISGSKTATLSPTCNPERRRKQKFSCDAVNIDFVAPSGLWTADLSIKDGEGEEIETHSFTLKSVETDALVIRTVSVCDASTAEFFATWQCEPAANLLPRLSLLRRIAPTAEVRGDPSSHIVRRRATDYPGGFIPFAHWWQRLGADIDALHSLNDSLIGTILGQEIYYHGGVRPSAQVGGVLGIANAIPSRGAASKTSFNGVGPEASGWVVAHEVGHTLGGRHTNSAQPNLAGGQAPGCWLGSDPDSSWPWADNRIRSGATNDEIEVGFDVAAKKALPGDAYFDFMGYCVAVPPPAAPDDVAWISPHNTLQLMEPTGPLALNSSPSGTLGAGALWLVSGVLAESGVEFDPLFEIDTTGAVTATPGTHRIEIVGSGGLLYTKQFTPTHTHVSSDDPDQIGNSQQYFGEAVPVQADANAVNVYDAFNDLIGSISLTGAAPSVTIMPQTAGVSGGTGVIGIEWSVDDPGSSDHTYWVDYSPDGGVSWQSQAMGLTDPRIGLDPDLLAGSDAALIRVVASDGVNSGMAISEPFAVAKKLPQAEIFFPGDGAHFGLGDLVWLQGMGYDVDDGSLDDASVEWTSSIDGTLGFGENLPVTGLSEGEHLITLEVTDSDANVATKEITVFVEDSILDETAPPPATPTPTPTPSASSTPGPTPTPTPTQPAGGDYIQGDLDCDDDADSIDALQALRHVVGTGANQAPGCPPIGVAVPAGGNPQVFGDVDCDGDVDAVDSLKILQFVAALPYSQNESCPDIGGSL